MAGLADQTGDASTLCEHAGHVYVLVPSLTTRLASLVFSGTGVSLVLLYGLHLGRAWYYGIPTSLISLSLSTVASMLLPGLFVFFAALASILPCASAVVRLFTHIQEGGWLGSPPYEMEHDGYDKACRHPFRRVMVSCMAWLIALVMCSTTWGCVYALPAFAQRPLTALHVICLTVALCFLICSFLHQRQYAVIFANDFFGRLCRATHWLLRVTLPLAAAIIVFAFLRSSPLVFTIIVPVPIIAVVVWSRKVTDERVFVVSTYSQSELHGEGQRWWRNSRICAAMVVCILAIALSASMVVGLNAAGATTEFSIVPLDDETRDQLPFADRDSYAYLCVLDWYANDRAVAVPAKLENGSYRASVADESFCIVDPGIIADMAPCQIEAIPEVGNSLILLSPGSLGIAGGAVP